MFGRRQRPSAADASPADASPADAATGAGSTGGGPDRAGGPYDSAQLGADDTVPRVDLGGLLMVPTEGIELRLQADQATGAVSSVIVATEGAALELRPYAAPKSGGLWDEVRREIVAEATRKGGTATESVGDHGPELRLQVPVQAPDGRNFVQVSRVVGVEGPRWFLRGTFFGAAATSPDAEGRLEVAFRDVVVVRGQLAMPPRDALALRLPPDARLPPPGQGEIPPA